MPSEITPDPSPAIFPETIRSESPSTTQHGLLPNDRPALSLLEHYETAGIAGQTGENSFANTARVFLASECDDATRLRQTGTPPYSRITDYEMAFATPPRKNSEGPLFEVVKRVREPDDKSSPISLLPNEVLTHALSHLSPSDLSAVSLVSRRFHDLITTPHAWRIAFARYFPGVESLVQASDFLASAEDADNLRSGRRLFTRLTALASWRSEFILRTRLLRSLNRGKPNMAPVTSGGRSGNSQTAASMIMYNSQLFTTVNHMHANFGTGLNKRVPRFIHGADDMGMASISEPLSGKIDTWGTSDPHAFFQFSDAYPGDAQYGLGPGEIIGCPNVMDVSQPYGMIYGEGHPNATLYYRGTDEMRGRFLPLPLEESALDLGIPAIPVLSDCICSVWIAKSSVIPSLSDGLVGMMSGSSTGVVSAYSLGSDGLRGQRIGRGEPTARWVLSPGVPIISIAVDEAYSLKRQAQNRVWAVALNALGEAFYLTKFPKRTPVTSKQGRNATPSEEAIERFAWVTGRTAYWSLVEPSRRVARADPYNRAEVDGSYSPRSSWDGMCLSTAQIRAETIEIEEYLRKKPKHFRQLCLGWDMQRRMEVDFAGDDGNYAGESIIVFQCGLEEDTEARIDRFTRCRGAEKDPSRIPSRQENALPTPPPETQSIFGGLSMTEERSQRRGRRMSQMSTDGSPERGPLIEEWKRSQYSFNGLKSVQITSTTIDCSTFASLTLSEDPTLGFSTQSNATSPFDSPQSIASQPTNPSDIPGHRARLFAAGTKTGMVILWDARAPVSKSAEYINTIDPVRVVYTDSPEISCLALTALYLVHGGNDGLVQAWDPLGSQTSPIRTLNSRFSQRARRRLVQNQARPQGVGINLFAAGAICLDPDATVLRGMVSLGTHLRFWSYSSSAADAYKSSKRRLRRAERGSNGGGERFLGGRSGNLKDYIAKEKYELQREEEQQRKEADRLAGRFGVDLLGNDEEALAYAAMLSQEAFANEEEKRKQLEKTEAGVINSSLASSTSIATPEPSNSNGTAPSPGVRDDDQLDADLAEAIRLSLQESGTVTPPIEAASSSPTDYNSYTTAPAFDIPIRYAKSRRSPQSGSKGTPRKSSKSPPSWAKGGDEGSANQEMSDLEFAMQLSLAEERSRIEAEQAGQQDEFPTLYTATGKGKGKGRA